MVSMPAPPYSAGTSMPIRPSWPISRMLSSGNSPLASSSAATGAMRFCAKSRAIDWIDKLVFGKAEIHGELHDKMISPTV